MKRRRRFGLDELMIINPGVPGLGACYLGQGSTLYQVQGLDETEDPAVGQFFLGEDGALYQVQGLAEFSLSGLAERWGGLGRFFLGEDGMLYEVVG
jgi:hypothetical protein